MTKKENQEANEAQAYVTVPRFLDPEQGLLDQPPFNWLLLEKDIFPDDLFANEQFSPAQLLRFSVGFFGSYAKLEDISEKYRKRGILTKIYAKISEYLRQYPFSGQYLSETWKGLADFDEQGNRQKNGGTFNIRSYAAYASDRNQKPVDNKWLGLGKELPDSSAATDVIDAMPPKPAANRTYRLFKSGALE